MPPVTRSRSKIAREEIAVASPKTTRVRALQAHQSPDTTSDGKSVQPPRVRSNPDPESQSPSTKRIVGGKSRHSSHRSFQVTYAASFVLAFHRIDLQHPTGSPSRDPQLHPWVAHDQTGSQLHASLSDQSVHPQKEPFVIIPSSSVHHNNTVSTQFIPAHARVPKPQPYVWNDARSPDARDRYFANKAASKAAYWDKFAPRFCVSTSLEQMQSQASNSPAYLKMLNEHCDGPLQSQPLISMSCALVDSNFRPLLAYFAHRRTDLDQVRPTCFSFPLIGSPCYSKSRGFTPVTLAVYTCFRRPVSHSVILRLRSLRQRMR